MTSYWRETRQPRYSVVFALPLLALYELLAAGLGGEGAVVVRNGADVLLKSLFVALGGHRGVLVFGGLLLLGGGGLVLADVRRHGWPRLPPFAGMAVESVGYAALLGSVAGALTSVLLGAGRLSVGGAAGFDLPTQLMLSLGAGLYEELLFRVLLVGALLALARRGFGWAPAAATAFAVAGSALIFSAFHYLGPYGDTLALGSFAYRAVAGLLLSGLYVARGFGIAAWSHALYDVGLAVAGG
ncbi:MAG TPA: CPBP family glutamic-type intramembrane protease [Gemmatimonadales bacterium]|nr:CPBP family glutamic-type intramembrane protease [Gemmatimonadales bacterium]